MGCLRHVIVFLTGECGANSLLSCAGVLLEFDFYQSYK